MNSFAHLEDGSPGRPWLSLHAPGQFSRWWSGTRTREHPSLFPRSVVAEGRCARTLRNSHFVAFITNDMWRLIARFGSFEFNVINEACLRPGVCTWECFVLMFRGFNCAGLKRLWHSAETQQQEDRRIFRWLKPAIFSIYDDDWALHSKSVDQWSVSWENMWRVFINALKLLVWTKIACCCNFLSCRRSFWCNFLTAVDVLSDAVRLSKIEVSENHTDRSCFWRLVCRSKPQRLEAQHQQSGAFRTVSAPPVNWSCTAAAF